MYMYQYVTYHGVSGNKVNARTHDVIIRLHANGWHAYRADMRIKTIDFGKRVRSPCSYLANTVELCFYNTLDFF